MLPLKYLALLYGTIIVSVRCLPKRGTFPIGSNDDPTLFQGDIKLTKEQRKIVDASLEKGTSVDSSAASYGLTNVWPKWDNGVVIYSFAYSIGASQQRAIYAAMNEWTTKTKGCIKFKRRTHEKNYVEFHVGSGCWGNIGQPHGKSQVSVGPRCDEQHIMAHEIGHVLGFWHEQSRPDRDSYIRILWQNVPGGVREAFAKYGHDKIDSLGVPYDYASIMHYPWNAFSQTWGKDTMKPIRRVRVPPYEHISPLDVKQAMLFYKCGGPIPTEGPVVPTKCVEKWVNETDGGDSGNNGNCKDTNLQCADWAKRGECTRNPDYMKKSCCASCNGGTSSGSCTDSNSRCPSWAASGECDKNPGYMKTNCKKSCKVCTPGRKKVRICSTLSPPTANPSAQPTDAPATLPPTDCVDKHTSCGYWNRIGECTRNPIWMKDNCCKSCSQT